MSEFATTCNVIDDLLFQRRRKAQFNIPPIRFNLVSPYRSGAFTAFQLDMRRKAEILQYLPSAQGSQTNNLTKKQIWSQKARGVNARTHSRAAIAQCVDGDMDSVGVAGPTWSTGCDVPGPPIQLYLDPSVPLYNYISTQRSYAFSPPSAAQWNSVSQNELNVLTSTQYVYTPDTGTNDTEQRLPRMGTLVFSGNASSDTIYTVNSITCPVGLYLTFVYGFGRIVDGTPVPPHLLDPTADNTLRLHVTGVQLQISNNGMPVAPLNVPIMRTNFTDMVVDLNCLHRRSGHFYGIQFLGMLEIDQIQLPASPFSIYDFDLAFTYTYDHTLLRHMDLFVSGVFPNLTEANQNVTSGITFSGPPPPSPYKAPTFQNSAKSPLG